LCFKNGTHIPKKKKGTWEMFLNLLFATKAQKILNFFLMHPEEFLYEREIARQTKISNTSANRSLKELYRNKIVNKKIQGKMCYYKLNIDNSFMKTLKLLANLTMLEILVEDLKKVSDKIVLFGSTSRGEDMIDSDIDIFIVTSKKEIVRKIVEKHNYSDKLYNRKIQAILKSPVDMLKTGEKEKVFMQEVGEGIVIWEREINETYF
jgi:predicted nucleotidyltransferase